MISMSGNSVGLMGGCMFQDIKVAVGILPVFLMPLILFSGFYSNQSTMMNWIGWLKYLSPIKYGFEALITNDFLERDYNVRA